MVYCSKCGTWNTADAVVCKNCGAPIQPVPQYNSGSSYYYYHSHRHRDEHGYRSSGLGALLGGIVIILVGSSLLFSEIYGVPVNWAAWWAIFIIVIGIWLIAIAFRRSRRYSSRSPPPH